MGNINVGQIDSVKLLVERYVSRGTVSRASTRKIKLTALDRYATGGNAVECLQRLMRGRTEIGASLRLVDDMKPCLARAKLSRTLTSIYSSIDKAIAETEEGLQAGSVAGYKDADVRRFREFSVGKRLSREEDAFRSGYLTGQVEWYLHARALQASNRPPNA